MPYFCSYNTAVLLIILKRKRFFLINRTRIHKVVKTSHFHFQSTADFKKSNKSNTRFLVTDKTTTFVLKYPFYEGTSNMELEGT
jgi:hypothetical protein